jgi:hypothetical protein
LADVREIVKEDRGLLKRFQAFLPGYKKYRNCEDLRVADDLLRRELANELSNVEEMVKSGREEASRNMDLDQIDIIGELVNYSHKITEKVRHAEQGYAPWISGDVRFEEDELYDLYDYDLAMFHYIEKLKAMASSLKDQFQQQDPRRSMTTRDLKAMYSQFESDFDMRISRVSKIAQVK